MNTVARAMRYLSTYGGLFISHVTLFPRLFWSVILSGIVFRFSSVMALVFSMKCAAWILHLDDLAAHSTTVHNHRTLVGLALVLVPLFLVIISAVAEVFHQRVSTEMSSRVAEHIAWADVRGTVAILHRRMSNRGFVEDHFGRMLNRFEQTYRKARRAEFLFVQIIVALSVLVLIMGAGLLIDFGLIAILIVLSIPLLASFVWRRHGEAQSNFVSQERVEADLDAAKHTVRRGLTNRSSRHWMISKMRRRLSSYATAMNNTSQNSEDFRAHTETVISIGQGIIISFVLLYLLLENAGSDARHVASIAVAIILIRYAIAQLRVIALSAIQLSRDYTMLVRLVARL